MNCKVCDREIPPVMLSARYWDLETDGSVVEVVARCPCGARYGACVAEDDFELMEIGKEVEHGAQKV